MHARPARGAGEIGAAHYRTLFGEPPPDKKNGRQSPKSEAGRNSKHRTSIVTRNVGRDKVLQPWPLG